MMEQRQPAVATFHTGTGALEQFRTRARYTLYLLLLGLPQARQHTSFRPRLLLQVRRPLLQTYPLLGGFLFAAGHLPVVARQQALLGPPLGFFTQPRLLQPLPRQRPEPGNA